MMESSKIHNNMSMDIGEHTSLTTLAAFVEGNDMSSLANLNLAHENILSQKWRHEIVELRVTDDDVESYLIKLVNQRQTFDHEEKLTLFDIESKETYLTCGLDGGASSETCDPPSSPLYEEAKASTSGLGCGTHIKGIFSEKIWKSWESVA
eukprot:Gb_38644 [translate_table: standard]